MSEWRHFLVPSCLALCVALQVSAAGAQPETSRPRVPRIDQIGDWRTHDPQLPAPGKDPWTPRDAARLLARFPEAFFQVEARSSYPSGNYYVLRTGEQVAELRAAASEVGAQVDGRLCVSLRPDVSSRLVESTGACDPFRGGRGCDWEGDMDGRFGEKEGIVKFSGIAMEGTDTSLRDATADWSPGRWNHRLLVLRPGFVSEESRRIVASDRNEVRVDSEWSSPPKPGDRYEIRGSFDPAWVQRVPRSVHEDTVRRLWRDQRDVCSPSTRCKTPAEPLDPFSSANRRTWPDWFDRAAVDELSTPSSVPALYGSVLDGGSQPQTLEDPYFRVSGLVMRLDDADYRAWRNSYLLYKLEDAGFAPGDTACVVVAYKPGWHTYYDSEAHGKSPDPCATEGSNMWTGPANVCRNGGRWSNGLGPGGPYHPTQFGPGVFERAISSFLLEMIATLEEYGYRNPRVITVERPFYAKTYWATLSDDVVSHPALAGELGNSLEPALPPQTFSSPVTTPSRATSAPGSAPASATESPTAGDAQTEPPPRPATESGGSWSIGSSKPKTKSSLSTASEVESRRGAGSVQPSGGRGRASGGSVRASGGSGRAGTAVGTASTSGGNSPSKRAGGQQGGARIGSTGTLVPPTGTSQDPCASIGAESSPGDPLLGSELDGRAGEVDPEAGVGSDRCAAIEAALQGRDPRTRPAPAQQPGVIERPADVSE